ncbi:MAG: rhodanese-like domain-containing protein [Desulfobacterales bacterium]|nr:rhodanese-like domain-containing protein [Desulfobacterales bacterium]
MVRKVLYEMALVLLLAAVLAVGGYALRPGALPLVATDPPSDLSDEPYKVIALDAAMHMFTSGEAIFADARPIVAYEAGHIHNALHLEPGAVEEWAEKLIANYAPDQPIIAYCEGEQCRLSLELAERLTWLPYEKVLYLVDGWGQWKRHGLPVDPQ